MNAKSSRVTAALADAGQPTPQSPPTTEGTKKRSPVPSPEFAQARLRRDIRVLDERAQNLRETFEEKMADIKTKRANLADELAAVDAKLNGAAGG